MAAKRREVQKMYYGAKRRQGKRQRITTNHFPFSIRAHFLMDDWEGALCASDVIRTKLADSCRLVEYDSRLALNPRTERAHARYVQAVYHEVAEMTEELAAKTFALEGEYPTDIAYFYQPKFTDQCGGFTLCALTRVSNNGTINVFAPEHEYLTVYVGREWAEIRVWKLDSEDEER